MSAVRALDYSDAQLRQLGEVHCQHFAAVMKYFGAYLYQHIATAMAYDLEMLRLMAHGEPGQPLGMLLFTAVHFELLAGTDEPLAEYFPSLQPRAKPAIEAYPAFRAYCMENYDRLASLLSTRTLQTTTVERAITVLLPLVTLTERVSAALSLVEIGPSAGLCLMFDHYGYDFGDRKIVGAVDSPVSLRPHFRGHPVKPPAHWPNVARRAGIELHPVNTADASARRWIKAGTYPEWREEIERLDTALALRANTQLDIVHADALKALPSVTRELGDHLCVLNSNCLYQWPQESRDALEEALRQLSRERVLHRVSIEPPQLTYAERHKSYQSGAEPSMDITLLKYESGRTSSEVLGRCDSHARWIEWFG
jgi:hypothetical protein